MRHLTVLRQGKQEETLSVTPLIDIWSQTAARAMASLKRSSIPLASLLQCFHDYVFLLRYFVQHQTLYSRRNLTFDLTSATPRPFCLQPGPDRLPARSLTAVIVYHVRLGQGMALAGLAAYGSSSEEEEDEEDEVKAKKTAGDQDSDDDEEEEEETQKEPPKAVPAQVMCLDEAPTSRARRPNVVIYT